MGPRPLARTHKSSGRPGTRTAGAASAGARLSSRLSARVSAPLRPHHVLPLLPADRPGQAPGGRLPRPGGPGGLGGTGFHARRRLPEWHLPAQLVPDGLVAAGPLRPGAQLRAPGLPPGVSRRQPRAGGLLATARLRGQPLLHRLQPAAHLRVQQLQARGRLRRVPAGRRPQDLQAALRVQLPEDLLSRGRR